MPSPSSPKTSTAATGFYLESGSTLYKDIHENTIDDFIVIKPVSIAGADTGNDNRQDPVVHTQAKENGYKFTK